MKRIIVTGALGQIGSELVPMLCNLYGKDNVLSTDIRDGKDKVEHFAMLDVTKGKEMYNLAKGFKADTIIHLAALLSANGEKQPKVAWDLNMAGLINALDVAKELKLKLFAPSSIAAFGPNTPKEHTPQDTIQRPTTIYGITKVAGELLCDYYFFKYGVDTRGIRFPGIVSNVTRPGGGTTDYAVEIYYAAVEQGHYTSYIAKGTYMDMIYMPDALNAIVQLMEIDDTKLKHRNAFNISAMSIEPSEIAAEIKKHIPTFTIDYKVDPVRQQIAESWPNFIDSTAAREEWGFSPKYTLATMTEDMLSHLKR